MGDQHIHKYIFSNPFAVLPQINQDRPEIKLIPVPY